MAEVLMVMAVIGIVAAITMPRLSDNIDEQALVAATKKAYSDLQIAYDAMITRYGEPDNWLNSLDSDKKASELLKNRLKETLDVALDCENSASGCMSLTDSSNSYYLKLKSGMSMSILGSTSIDFTCDAFQYKYLCYPQFCSDISEVVSFGRN